MVKIAVGRGVFVGNGVFVGGRVFVGGGVRVGVLLGMGVVVDVGVRVGVGVGVGTFRVTRMIRSAKPLPLSAFSVNRKLTTPLGTSSKSQR